MELKNELVTKNERLILCFSAFIFGTLIVIVASFNGALGVPRNDDAFYLHTAFEFARTGRFVPVSSANMLIGQTALAFPIIAVFGESIAALQILNVLFAVVGLCAFYFTMRIFLKRWISVFSIVPLAVGPIYGNLSVSFMSDIQALAFQGLSIYCFSKFITSYYHNKRHLYAALIFAVIAFSIRQSSASVLLSIAALLPFLFKFKLKGWFLKIYLPAILAVISCLLIYRWRSNSNLFIHSPTHLSEVGSPVRWSLRAATQFVATYAIYLAPLLVLISPKKTFQQVSVLGKILVIASGTLTMTILGLIRPEPNGNYFTKFVPYVATVNASTDDLFSMNEWRLIKVFSYVTATIFAMAVVSAIWKLIENRQFRMRTQFVPIFLFVCTVVTFLMLNTLTFGGGFDRYGLLLIPLSAAIVGKSLTNSCVTKIRTFVALIIVAFIASIGARTISASTLFDGTKNEIATLLVSKGVNAKSIDGGYEWFAYFQTDMSKPETNIFDLWFAYNTGKKDNDATSPIVDNQICYVTRLLNRSLGDTTVVTMDKEDIFGWKTHLEMQKLSNCP